jgi:hypothetical protein
VKLADREEFPINFFCRRRSQKNFAPRGSLDQSAALTDLKEWYQAATDSWCHVAKTVLQYCSVTMLCCRIELESIARAANIDPMRSSELFF